MGVLPLLLDYRVGCSGVGLLPLLLLLRLSLVAVVAAIIAVAAVRTIRRTAQGMRVAGSGGPCAVWLDTSVEPQRVATAWTPR